MVNELARLGINGTPMPWVKLRASTEQKNLAGKLIKESGERETKADISAERQRRLDSVRELWEAGCSPREIQDKLNLKHESVYHDLRDLGIDQKQSKQAKDKSATREALLSRIKGLIDEGKQYKEIGPIVGLSPEMVGHYARKYLNVKDGRKRQANRRKQPLTQ